ncbi:MAG: hypothetical protein ACREC3_15415, partial [Methyloceanibacter sp.]
GIAARQVERMHALVIGNTWAWPTTDPGKVRFSKILGSGFGRFMIRTFNVRGGPRFSDHRLR